MQVFFFFLAFSLCFPNSVAVVLMQVSTILPPPPPPCSSPIVVCSLGVGLSLSLANIGARLCSS